MTRAAPVLDRDDPDKPPLSGATKVTREDWLRLARDILVHDGEGEVKVLAMAQTLGVSRSSFYWYFKDKQELLQALLEEWDNRNTQVILRHCQMPAASITGAVCNFFRCFVDPDLFDPGLDFAIREWSRRDAAVRDRIDEADTQRLTAITAMFERHGFTPEDADIRARILYFMQLGYHALDLREAAEARMARIEGYLKGFTGLDPDMAEIGTFLTFAKAKMS